MDLHLKADRPSGGPSEGSRALPSPATADPVTSGSEVETARARRGPAIVLTVVTLIGLAITTAAALAARSLDQSNEERLLRVQTRQAAALITAEVVNITSPLETALHVANATDGSSEQFSTIMTGQVGQGRPFVDASLWRTDSSTPTLVIALGVAPEPVSSTSALGDLLRRAVGSDSFVVEGLPAGNMSRIA